MINRTNRMKKNKRGLSAVIATLILIALTMTVVLVVWGVVVPLVKEQLEETESCFGVFEKVIIDSMYTCYNFSSNRFQFSINIKDVDVDEVVVSISGEGATKSFKITNEQQTIPGLANYGSTGFGTDWIKLPEKNAGLTYIASGFPDKPDFIQIAPVINGKQCDVSDSLSNIDNCLSLA
jgi:FlaG/FlaF family flagellin (archaellin)